MRRVRCSLRSTNTVRAASGAWRACGGGASRKKVVLHEPTPKLRARTPASAITMAGAALQSERRRGGEEERRRGGEEDSSHDDDHA
jgi:hypothetical protein